MVDEELDNALTTSPLETLLAMLETSTLPGCTWTALAIMFVNDTAKAEKGQAKIKQMPRIVLLCRLSCG